jgi:hypothetical protein
LEYRVSSRAVADLREEIVLPSSHLRSMEPGYSSLTRSLHGLSRKLRNTSAKTMFLGMSCSTWDTVVSVTGIARNPVVRAIRASVLEDGQIRRRRLNVVSIRTSLK